MPEPGDVIITMIQFTDSFEVKMRPAVVLFEEFNNITVAGVTSNTAMQGIPLTKDEGAVKDSVIKTNYIFTISKAMIAKQLFKLSKDKRNTLFEDLKRKLKPLVP